MAAGKGRTLEQIDVDRAARAVAEIFGTDTVYVVGSQALLVARPDVERTLRNSLEVDIYPSNAREWEAKRPGEEASEEIFARIGDGSPFHQAHGYYVDGVDDQTAMLPPDWQERRVVRTIQSRAGMIRVIAPSPGDLVASKLCRGDPKDMDFARGVLRMGLAKHGQIMEIIGKIDADPVIVDRALHLLERAAKSKSPRKGRKGRETHEPLEILMPKRPSARGGD